MIKTKMQVSKIEKLYKVTNRKLYNELLEEAKTNGFANIDPIVVVENDFGYFAITGSHRYAVAEELGLDINVELYQINEIDGLLERHDVDDAGAEKIKELKGAC